MGLFDKIFGKWKQKTRADSIFKTLTAYSPVFTSWGGEIYESELVRAAINARAVHISKLKVEIHGSAKQRLQTRMKQAPNSFQTWGQFLYRLSTILDVQNTAFIVPVLDEYGEACGVYPVLPSRCTVVENAGEPWLRYQFSTGQVAAMEMKYCGILTKFQYQSDFFGENNHALHPTMELINMQDQGICEATRQSSTFRFMARLNNFSNDKDLAEESKRFTRDNMKNDSAVLLFPNTYADVKQIDSKPFVVDAEQMKCIRENVFDYFGVNSEILQNKVVGDSWNAFYEGAVEPFAIQLSDVLTKMLFTESERSHHAFVMATANRLQYMSTADKINYATQMGDRGMVSVNEVREVFNLPPVDGGERMPIRGEYYNANEKKEGKKK